MCYIHYSGDLAHHQCLCTYLFQNGKLFLVLAAGLQSAAAGEEDDFGDFLSVPAGASQPQPQPVPPQPQISPNQKLVTSAAGPKAIITEPPAAPKEEKKGTTINVI